MGIMIADAVPATTKMERQPYAPMTPTATRPAMMMPAGNPKCMKLKAKLRRSSDEYSATMVFRLARIAPIPRPVTNRAAITVFSDGATAVRKRPAVISARKASIVLRRPKTSASGANRNEATVMPATPELKSSPSCSGDTPHSFRITGAAKAMTNRSNPSSVFSIQQMMTTRICSGAIFC